jgi:hypothetical protein
MRQAKETSNNTGANKITGRTKNKLKWNKS